MTDQYLYWKSSSPYWSYIEDNFLDLDSIEKLSDIVEDPALIIGAGQGMLVEALRKKGLSVDGIDAEPEMVAFAKKRRGLDIILSNGKKIPLSNGTYRTSIIATGVIDFIDDEKQIHSILNEAMRVTNKNGTVLIAFYRLPPQGEKLMRYLGLLTDKSRWRVKRMYELFRLKPLNLLKTIASEADINLISALLMLVKLRVNMDFKERQALKRWTKMWKSIDKPDELIASVPESVPCRNVNDIKKLFDNLDIPIKDIFQLTSCFTVQVLK